MTATASFKYQLFLSYTRRPDDALAREIERFLESFHQTPLEEKAAGSLQPLQICVDGSDFSMPPLDDAQRLDADQRNVLTVIFEHLARSRELLVLCSKAAAKSAWVEEEIRWFLENRGAGAVRLAFTEGAEPWNEPAVYYPGPILEQGLGENIAYDLRGYDTRRSQGWRQVPEFEREMVRLAADLYGLSAGDLYPSWLEAELQRARTQSLTMASTARFETLAGDPVQAVLKAYEAHELHPGDETEEALREAYKVAVLHHQNRREIAHISGSGPRYLAGRWKQGAVFVKTSPDGRYRVLVTERGKDGPSPPGDVYLVSNETLRAVKLEPDERGRGRVEDVAFDRDSRHVFVTRYFNLSIYSLEGRRVGGYEFSRHTKSPVHLVAGYFAGRYILGGETKGGIWLVHPGAAPSETLQVLREFHGDALTFADISPSGERAALVFESTRAALLSLDESGQPHLAELLPQGVLYAGFALGSDDSLVTAGEDGELRFWGIEGEAVREQESAERVAAALDWVSLSEDGRRLASVGSDQRIYILDRGGLKLLSTLDYSTEIDWAATRAVSVPSDPVRPGAEVTLEDPIQLPSDELRVRRVISLDGMTWLFTVERQEGEYVSTDRAFLLDDNKAYPIKTNTTWISKHRDILWLHGSFDNSGPAFWLQDGRLRRFPGDDSYVHCVCEDDDAVWLGTSRGAYFHSGNQHRRATPGDLDVREIKRVGGRLWISTWKQGAYVIEDEQLIGITEPFLQIRKIKEVGGRVWFFANVDKMFDTDGPAYVVDGYFARALPGRRSKVSDVLQAAGHAWIVEEHDIYRVDPEELRRVSGFATNVNAMAAAGNTLWATTHSRGFMSSSGPTYRVDLERLVAEEVDLKFARIHQAGGVGFICYSAGGSSYVTARVCDEGLSELDLGGGYLYQVVELDGTLWLLTGTGAYRCVDQAHEPAPGPVRAYHGAAQVEGQLWLLAKGGVLRLEADGHHFFDTDDHATRAVKSVDGEIWVLTGELLGDPGPAYRLGEGGAVAHLNASGGGIIDVVEIEGEIWLLTDVNGMPGPLERAGDSSR